MEPNVLVLLLVFSYFTQVVYLLPGMGNSVISSYNDIPKDNSKYGIMNQGDRLDVLKRKVKGLVEMTEVLDLINKEEVWYVYLFHGFILFLTLN